MAIALKIQNFFKIGEGLCAKIPLPMKRNAIFMSSLFKADITIPSWSCDAHANHVVEKKGGLSSCEPAILQRCLIEPA